MNCLLFVDSFDCAKDETLRLLKGDEWKWEIKHKLWDDIVD